MATKRIKTQDTLNLTQEESASLGVVFPEELTPASMDARQHLLHEQVAAPLIENDVTEALTGEVTPESREDVEDLFADLQEEEADRSAN